MAEIRIDSKLFQERISHFATAWKNDLRSKDSVFAGASSMVVMMGKVEEVPEFHKNNAMHVSRSPRDADAAARPARADARRSFGSSDTSSRRR